MTPLQAHKLRIQELFAAQTSTPFTGDKKSLKTQHAHCTRDGVIIFTFKKDEDGLVRLASGKGTKFLKDVAVLASLSREDNHTMFVPDLTMKTNDDDAFAAVSRFKVELHKRGWK